ncbi:unnamed protein product [Chondrus crispus]|uniref:Uncharacterized protein n=1 Tax=Chondrus crispus TaxID=2769 RepID=R7QMC4_CHOCR|nr:unnamed protein product [Chondrus crispus]CDF38520.1 unnamed protein product [Chondrus crispus]|eukprot:XP_005718413.1 unnamed protein product [Chondrus crispus]
MAWNGALVGNRVSFPTSTPVLLFSQSIISTSSFSQAAAFIIFLVRLDRRNLGVSGASPSPMVRLLLRPNEVRSFSTLSKHTSASENLELVRLNVFPGVLPGPAPLGAWAETMGSGRSGNPSF